jgi:hypothetical protein
MPNLFCWNIDCYEAVVHIGVPKVESVVELRVCVSDVHRDFEVSLPPSANMPQGSSTGPAMGCGLGHGQALGTLWLPQFLEWS